MFDLMQDINRRPAPFAHYTAADLWTDEHISAKMLAYHLDGTTGLSSRKFEFIDRSANWIVDRFGLDQTRSVADFGCGPGLYTSRFAQSGADVTGIDFSRRSLDYARETALKMNLNIAYECANYLEYETDKRFDLITMIMCDFCALSPEQRRTMLEKWRRLLKPGGAILLDAYTLHGYESRAIRDEFAENLLDGFFSPSTYYGFMRTFKYDDEKVVLDKYTIIENSRIRTMYNWLQYFSRESIAAEFKAAGLAVEEFLGDVAGSEYDPQADEFAVIARCSEVHSGSVTD